MLNSFYFPQFFESREVAWCGSLPLMAPGDAPGLLIFDNLYFDNLVFVPRWRQYVVA